MKAIWCKNQENPSDRISHAGAPLRKSKLQKKPSALKGEHPALQIMKFLKFFLLLDVVFALPDPDLLT